MHKKRGIQTDIGLIVCTLHVPTLWVLLAGPKRLIEWVATCMQSPWSLMHATHFVSKKSIFFGGKNVSIFFSDNDLVWFC